MRRAHLVIAAVLGGTALAVPAHAGFFSGPLDNQYEGRAERDPGTYVGFDVVKKRGQQKVTKVTALLAYGCEDGDGGRAAARVKGKLEVHDGHFAGTLRSTAGPAARAASARRGGETKVKYRISGRLLKRGKASGEIDAEILRFKSPGPRLGEGGDRCYSGGLDWKAKRGANVEPDIPTRGGLR